MQPLELIKSLIEGKVTGAQCTVLPATVGGATASLLIDLEHAVEVARFLKNDPDLRFDYLSNVTGVDWPDKIIAEKTRAKETIDGIEREIERTTERKVPGFIEVVYHLYSMCRKVGPLVLRLRTVNRSDQVTLPSFTPLWRAAEFQEREVYDLFGVIFAGHPDLRRILMWDGFEDHPMRKDYVEPDDYEFEPTPHDDVLEKARAHHGRDKAE